MSRPNMACQPPNSTQEQAYRKILEELQLKKQLLLKQGVVSNLNSSPNPTPVVNMPAGTDTHGLTISQRTALQHAQNQSYGYFIPQDSLFGNIILPVLPRADTK